MEIRDKKNILNDDYKEYAFKTDYGEFNFSVDPESGYTLFQVISKGGPTDINTTIGLNKEDACTFALALLGHVHD